MAFVHLHVHTEYSLLDGSNKIGEYVARVKELGMDSAAITDHGVMYGVIDFYRAAKKAGIRPIIGCEVYVAPGSRFEKEQAGGEDRYYHLVLLAENNIGYANLMKIVSRGFTEGYYYKPRVDMEVLRTFHEGIIALSACLAGEVQKCIVRGLLPEAREAARKYEQCFGKGNFFLELQDHGLQEQRLVNMELVRMSREMDIPLVATNDVHYTYAGDADSHDILLCLQTGKKLADENRMRYEGGQYYVKSEAEMRELFPYALEAVENTARIAERCNVEIEFGVAKLPHYEVPEGYDSWSYLNKLCRDGLKERYGDVTRTISDTGQTLEERLTYELDIIRSMGFVDYFLIVWDFINYARQNGIPVGPGRGSAAGSVVAYSLKITNIDPIRFQLLFERFLNPERVTMPDIDTDFCYERRQEVIDYVGRKYGSEKVVQIVTFGTLAAKGVIRDVARVMDLPYSYADSLARMVPNELNITLDRALEMNPDFRKLYETDEQVKHLIDMCKRLEGLPRHTSMHAAGVVICPEAAEEFVPLSRGSDGSIVTQFTMTTLEELGLLKMDFLGLRTLTVIHDAADFVEETRGKRPDVEALDCADSRIFEYIGTGKTEGIFQLESSGMKSFMKELQPRTLEDVIAGISLYRPGPMDFIPKYIQGKNSRSTVTYACPQLEPILEPTYGCIVYQEQVMQIVRDLGGYTLGRADLVRRAMSKKKQSVMEKERANFIYGNEEEGVPGCIARGIPENVAGQIYDEMMDFAKYAFNKSHAAGYAVVTYQTAWLKYYYPVEFMAALMTSVIDNPRKITEYILTCKSLGITMIPPDINEGEAGFSVAESGHPLSEPGPAGGSIRYALTAIKGIGRPVSEAITLERRARGHFKNLKDFITRMSDKDVNRKAIENLIKAGAMDSLGGTRKQFMSVYGQIMEQNASEKKNNLAGQLSLFDIAPEESKKDFELKMPDVGEYEKAELLAYEKEVLGFYVSGHPLEEYQELWERFKTKNTDDFVLDEETGETGVRDQEPVIVGGMIAGKSVKYTKNDKAMAFLTLEDLVGSVEVVVFSKAYERYAALLTEEAKIFVRGRVSLEEEKDGKVLCEQIVTFEEAARTGIALPGGYGRGRRGSMAGGYSSGSRSYFSDNEGYSSGSGSYFSGNEGYPSGSEGYLPGNGGYQADIAGYASGNNGYRSGSGSGAAGSTGTSLKTGQSGKRLPTGLWVRFDNADAFSASRDKLYQAIAASDGNDDVVIYLKDKKQIKILPPNRRVQANEELRKSLAEIFGEGNVVIRL